MSESAEDSEKHDQDYNVSFKNVCNDKAQMNSNKRIDDDTLNKKNILSFFSRCK